jgi:hypothetical protein
MDSDTCQDNGGGIANTLLQLGLVVQASNPPVDGLRIWASKPGMKFGMDFGGACGVIVKLASMQSKVVKSSWLSDTQIST